MSIVTNGTTIPEDGDNIIYDGVAVTEVICNGVAVWNKLLSTHTLTVGNSVDTYGWFPGLYGDCTPTTFEGLALGGIYITNPSTDTYTMNLLGTNGMSTDISIEFEGVVQLVSKVGANEIWAGTSTLAMYNAFISKHGVATPLNLTAG